MSSRVVSPLSPLIILSALLGLLLTANVAAQGSGLFSLNLKSADIENLISTVSEATGTNFVVDPRVQGKVTVISAEPMDAEALYKVFQSILQVHGYALVTSGEVTKIVPEAAAKQSGSSDEPRARTEPGDELVTQVLFLEHVSASNIVPIVRPLVPQQAHLAAYAPGNVLVFSDRAANIERIVGIIEQIDRPTDEEVEIVPVRHSTATEIVKTVNALSPRTAGPNTATAPVVVADAWSNSVLLQGSPGERLRLRALVLRLDIAKASDRMVVRLLQLDYADIKAVEGLLTTAADRLAEAEKSLSTNAATTGTDPAKVSIQIDEINHTLLLVGPVAQVEELIKIAGQLDVPRKQVLVQAMIAEATSDNLGELGIQWRLPDGVNGPGALGGFSSGLNTPTINSALTSPLSLGNGFSLGLFDGTKTILGTEFVNFSVLLRALSSLSNTNILSTPSLVVRDNQEAEIVVGQNVPFLTGQFTTSSSSTPDNPFQTIERQDIGLTLKVKPRIATGNQVRLDIDQVVSSISRSASVGATDLVTNKRSIKTSVDVENGRVVVLGGLIDDSVIEQTTSVPVLGELPVVGNLFKSDSSSAVKRNLMVFIQPTVLGDQARYQSESDRRYDFIRDKQTERVGDEVKLIDGEPQVVLPPRANAVVAEPAPAEVPPSAGNQSGSEFPFDAWH